MDYGIIFIILIIIIIIISIIIIIYANRTNSINILATFQNYRIQQVDTPDINNYIGLKNSTMYNYRFNPTIKLSDISFWSAFSCSGLDNNDPLGIWKIENIQQNNEIPITSGSQVYLVNYVYNIQSNNGIGYLGSNPINIDSAIYNFLSPTFNINNATIFIYNIIGNNIFTLQTKINNEIKSVIVDRTNNFLSIANNIKISPSVFKLDFQQQKQQ